MQTGLILTLLMQFFAGANFGHPPAGTSAVPGLRKVFLDKTEVTNEAWRFYLSQLTDTAERAQAMPDTAVWHQAYSRGNFHSEAYSNHPVVGLNYQQAIAYCHWRSRYTSGRENRSITFALPSIKIYRLAQSNQSDNKVAEGLYSVNLGFRTFLGLCDNAAEMTDVEGEAIRGSEREFCLETKVYYAPEFRLGFRCMAELN